jgi:predicted ATPase/class 3 adenylate cyclase/DNA-binding XRE family transcriptional regulator
MSTDQPMPFADLLKRHRLAAGLSQEELAERAGLSPRSVSDLERGTHTAPRPATVRLLADALRLVENERTAFIAAALGNSPPGMPPESVAAPPPSSSTNTNEQAAFRLPDLPSGTVTFLFTDIEGSTRLLQQLGPRYADVLGAQQHILRTAFAAHGGHEVDTQGDSFFAAFPTARDAIACAVEAQWALGAELWPEGVQVWVRMGLHSGAPQLVGKRYVGLDVHRAARIAAAGHGGQILVSAATAELVRHDVPHDAGLRDLGAHHLKDLQQAEHIYQLVLPDLPAGFPPLKVLDAHPHNLPVQTTTLLGRELEVTMLCVLLRRADVRLVTLTGSGGVGKTRLSLQVAAEVLDAFPDGVWNVRLSRLSDPALVVPTIAAALELKESGAVPLVEVLQNHLRDKQLLLVLDNFEQVVAAAPRVGELLEHCAGLKLLVTSRVTLHLHGEHEYTLKPLALPDPAHLPPLDRFSQYAAVALFVERAQAARADFQVTNVNASAVAAICARLDGLPLAIELAAARVKLLPPPALLARLERALPVLTGGARNVDERQQTMRNTLAWSYDLLSPKEQRLFRRLAVFVGGCTLEVAEAVCTAPDCTSPLEIDLLDGLSALVDHCLVQQRAEEERAEPRFSLLYIVREYALEQLEASGEVEALRRAHAAYMVALAERAEPHLYGPQARLWLDRLEREHDNMRAALDWARHTGETMLSLRLAGTLKEYWYRLGYIGEGLTWLLAALDEHAAARASLVSASDAVAATIDVKALSAAGLLTLWHTDYLAACALFGSCAALAQATGNLAIAADALHHLSLATFLEGDQTRALEIMEEAIVLARQQADPDVLSLALCNLGYLCYHLGDLERSAASLSEGLALARQVGDAHCATINLMQLGQVARRQGDPSRARAVLGEALHLAREVGDPRLFAETIEYVADLAAEAGQGERAARLLGAATKVREPIGFPQVPVDWAETETLVAPVRAALGEKAWAAAFEAGTTLSLDEAIAEALGEDVTGER